MDIDIARPGTHSDSINEKIVYLLKLFSMSKTIN